MKNYIRKYGLASSIFILSLIAIYAYQQSLVLQKENLHEIKGIYKKIALKEERQNPAKFYLENDNKVYVLKRNAYKAWNKHGFLETTKKGDELTIGIDKKYSKLLSNKKNQVINIVTMHNSQKGKNYLTLMDYNSHQKAGQFKLYLLSSFFFVMYLFIKNLKKRTYKIS